MADVNHTRDSDRDDSPPGDEKFHKSQRIQKSELYKKIEQHQWPILYSSHYDISFWGLQKLHPFDSGKWGKICNFLKKNGLINDAAVIEPSEATPEDLLVVHSQRYIETLKSSKTVAQITEIGLVAILPNSTVQRRALQPFRYQTGGTIAAAQLALERGWAFNIGGGFHHCCAEMGGGFCAYADITLAINFLFERTDIEGRTVSRAMIIDLDAHQGNGHERDFMDDDRVYILDVFNADIYPMDTYAKRAIRKKVQLHCGVGDDVYLEVVQKSVRQALDEFSPDIVVYNAGTDILEADPLGRMNVTKEGIIRRDEIVFREVRQGSQGAVPIVMVTSGGYQKCTADIVATSIIQLHHNKLIDGPKVKEAEKSKKWSKQ